MANALSNPTVEINDQVISIIPNTLSYKRGAGDVNVRAQSAGGDSVEAVITENAETKIGMVKFSLAVTDANQEYVRTWQENKFNGGNTVRISSRVMNTPLSFTNMNVTSDPEFSIGADGTVEVEFLGEAG
tara:strand:+ start:101 stop:490 length:390 start_codon:yes stop_codon:yes gene_type:complete